MLKCHKCGNKKNFTEEHIGGMRKHEWTQENGRMIFDGSSYDKVDDTYFRCGKCNADVSNQYREFLRLLHQHYDEKLHGN